MTIAPHQLPCERSEAVDLQIKAFEALYREHKGRILGYCMRLVRNEDVAEELMQETFLRVWRRMDTLDVSKVAWPWLEQIAKNVCRDRYRQARRLAPERLALEDEEDDLGGRYETLVAPPADAELLTCSLEAELEVALADLKPRYKHLLYLHAIEGWSYRDLAQVEGSTVTSVAKILVRAKRCIRRILGEHQRPSFGFVPPAFAWVRRRVRFTQARATNLVSWAGTVVRDVAYYQVVLPGLLGASAFLIPLPAAASTLMAADLPAPATTSIVVPHADEDGQEVQRQRLSVDTERAAVLVETDTQRAGGVDPTGGRLRIEVKDEDGEPLLWYESKRACGNGGDLMPVEGPVAIYC